MGQSLNVVSLCQVTYQGYMYVCISLCHVKGKPPLRHDKACSMENFLPQAQIEGLTVAANCVTEPGHSEKQARVQTPRLRRRYMYM